MPLTHQTYESTLNASITNPILRVFVRRLRVDCRSASRFPRAEKKRKEKIIAQNEGNRQQKTTESDSNSDWISDEHAAEDQEDDA